MASNPLIKKTLATFLAVLISTSLLIGFTYGGSFAYSSMFPSSTLLDKGTRVANISIGDKTIDEAIKLLYAETEAWKAANTISFHYKDKYTVNVASTLFNFDIEGAVQYAVVNQIAPLIVSINEATVNEMLNTLSSAELAAKIDRDRLYNDLQAFARSLKEEEHQVNLHDYFLPEHAEEQVIVSEAYITNFVFSDTLKQMVSILNGTSIEPRQTTSFLTMVPESAHSHSYEMSVIATGLYQVFLETNFEVIERHISQFLPEYSDLGLEAFVSFPSHDLRVYNPNYISYVVEMNLQSDLLHLKLTGIPFETSYRIEKEKEQSFDPKTVLQFSANVADGQMELVSPGQPGFAVNVVRKIYSSNGSLLGSELITEDFYRPKHRVELRSLIKKEEPSTFIDFESGLTNPNQDLETLPTEPIIDEENQEGIPDEQSTSNEEIKGY